MIEALSFFSLSVIEGIGFGWGTDLKTHSVCVCERETGRDRQTDKEGDKERGRQAEKTDTEIE